MSKIDTVEAWTVRVPLTTPVQFGTIKYIDRDYTVVRITDNEGARGLGYCLARNAPLAAVVHAIAPTALGTDPGDTDETWDSIYAATIPIGQRGLALRALSLIDVATWDLKARRAGRPVHELLGTARTEIPVMVGGGYFRERRDVEDVRDEMASYIRRGFDLIKIPAGGADPAYEEEWVGGVREMLGPDVGLAIDTHWTWRNPDDAASVLRRVDQFGLSWVEDPLWPECIRELAELRGLIRSPLAVGDELSGRWVYREMGALGSADIFRVDVTTVGGFTEFRRIAALAADLDIPISTHVYLELHAHCAAASEIVRWTEYVDPGAEIDMTHRFIDTPIEPRDGRAATPAGPGLGIELDWDWIESRATEHFLSSGPE